MSHTTKIIGGIFLFIGVFLFMGLRVHQAQSIQKIQQYTKQLQSNAYLFAQNDEPTTSSSAASVDLIDPICATEIGCQPAITQTVDPQDLTNFLAGQPSVEKVTMHPSTGDQIAILFLQRHKSPGSSDADAVNDLAEIVQKDIADTMELLHSTHGITPVLMEGKIHGEQETQAIRAELAQTRATVADIQLVTDILDDLKNTQDIPPVFHEELAAAADTFASTVHRSLLLRGGAVYTAAHGTPLRIVGAETPETYAQSATIVVEYMQLTNRLKTLAASPGTRLVQQLRLGQTAELLDLQDLLTLQQQLRATKLSRPATPHDAASTLSVLLKDVALYSFDPSVTATADQAQEVLSRIQGRFSAETPVAVMASSQRGATHAVPRENPYAQSYDIDTLSTRLEAVEQDMQTVVVDQRNTDTADNFVSMLEGFQTQVGMIQFGAQHEAGLVDALVARGVTVISVTPQHLR